MMLPVLVLEAPELALLLVCSVNAHGRLVQAQSSDLFTKTGGTDQS